MSILGKTPSALHTDGAPTPPDQYDHEIKLVDHTRPIEEPLSPQEPENGLPTPFSTTSSGDPLKHLWTRDGLQRERQRRRYARYQEDRVLPQQRPPAQKRSTIRDDELPSSTQRSFSNNLLTQVSQSIDEDAPGLSRKRDTIRHHKNKVKEAVKDGVRGPRPKHAYTDTDSLFDVLYENQRGAFFCGIPRFSSKSLLNFDPPPWQTQTFHPSPVDITNAQVPDPSWVWARGWNNWYVDMSFGRGEPMGAARKDMPIMRDRGDTDEEGWRYSFAFGQRAQRGWHGTHPWFHSFVRRRRWVRLRVKRGHPLAPEGAKAKPKAENEGHTLNADYFTIHNSQRPSSRYAEGPEASERTEDKRYSAATSARLSRAEFDAPDGTAAEIGDMPSLLRAMRKAAVDREKIAALKSFLEHGGDELRYLADNMEEIMSLLIFPTSRTQLQSILKKHLHDARREKGKAKYEEHTRPSEETLPASQSTYLEDLQRANDAAKYECGRLDRWSARHIAHRKRKGDDRTSSDDCDERGQDNRTPIGGTTVFSDDVDNGTPGTLEFEGTRGRNSIAAPDRPASKDRAANALADNLNPVNGGDETDEPHGNQGHQVESQSASESEEREQALDQARSPSPPELKRFVTAQEELEGDDAATEDAKR